MTEGAHPANGNRRWGWQLDAACRGSATSPFFSDDREDMAAAKAICAKCPVVADCLEFALAHADFGVWGGLTADERRGVKRQRRQQPRRQAG